MKHEEIDDEEGKDDDEEEGENKETDGVDGLEAFSQMISSWSKIFDNEVERLFNLLESFN